MKSTILHLVLTAAFALPVMAGKSVPNAVTEPVTGKVTWVSPKNDKISLKVKGAESSVPSSSFLITADTKVTVGGEAKTAADIKAGHNAMVTPKAGDPATAAAIDLTGKPSAPKPAADKAADKKPE